MWCMSFKGTFTDFGMVTKWPKKIHLCKIFTITIGLRFELEASHFCNGGLYVGYCFHIIYLLIYVAKAYQYRM